MLKLCPGMIVLTKRGVVKLTHRNAGKNSWMWGAIPYKKGKLAHKSFQIITNEDVIGFKKGKAFQAVLPGMLPSERPF